MNVDFRDRMVNGKTFIMHLLLAMAIFLILISTTVFAYPITGSSGKGSDSDEYD
ncbi:MAG: hypothetical protein AABX69_01720 [Nanoarchaeota archaeon]